jgi:hypothetical protein
MFGLRALLAAEDTPLPPPSSPGGQMLEPWLVTLLVLLPPVGLFMWWRRYRRPGP